MNVLFVTNLINSGGVAKVVLELASSCRQLCSGFECDILTYEEPNEETSSFLKEKGIGFYVTKRFTKSPLKYFRKLKAILKTKKYDVVHSHIEYFNWVPCKVAKKNGVRVTCGHAHGQKGRSNSLLFRMIESIGRKNNEKYCDVKLACSDPSGKYVFGKDYLFFPNFVDVEEIILRLSKKKNYYDELNLPKDSFVLGFMGYFGYQKNPILAVKVFQQLYSKNKNLVLVMCGEGMEKQGIEDYLKKEHIDNRVKLLGQRSDNVELISFFDCLITPSFSEGMSIALLEAQICGTPCLVSPGVPLSNDLGFGLFFRSDSFEKEAFVKAFYKMREQKKETSFDERLSILKEEKKDKESVISNLLSLYNRQL